MPPTEPDASKQASQPLARSASVGSVALNTSVRTELHRHGQRELLHIADSHGRRTVQTGNGGDEAAHRPRPADEHPLAEQIPGAGHSVQGDGEGFHAGRPDQAGMASLTATHCRACTIGYSTMIPCTCGVRAADP